MNRPDVPLDPRDIAEIDTLLADETDPEIKDAARLEMLRRLQLERNKSAHYRNVYREALERARNSGDPHAEITAEYAAKRQRVMDQYERRVRAIFKRVEHTSRHRANRLQRKIETASKSANRHRRRFPNRDREYVEIVGEAEKRGYLDNAALVLQKLNSKLGTYRLDHWEKTTAPLKVMAMSVVSAREGAQTINLHLSPRACKKAATSSRGPASHMQDAIRRALERAFGRGNAPDFWFVLEGDDTNRFHLHGAVITPAVVNGVSLVNKALRSAAGEWNAAGGQQHQQLAAELLEPLYWASYVCKHMNITGRELEARLMASSRGMSARASAAWDDIRRSLPQSP